MYIYYEYRLGYLVRDDKEDKMFTPWTPSFSTLLKELQCVSLLLLSHFKHLSPNYKND